MSLDCIFHNICWIFLFLLQNMLFKSFVCRHVDLCACTCVSQSVWRFGIIAQESVCLIFLNILLACGLPLFFFRLACLGASGICLCLQWWNCNHMLQWFLVWLFFIFIMCSRDEQLPLLSILQGNHFPYR